MSVFFTAPSHNEYIRVSSHSPNGLPAAEVLNSELNWALSCRIPPFSIAGYKGALGRRGGLRRPPALPACARHLSAGRAGSARRHRGPVPGHRRPTPPGGRCGVTSGPPGPGAGSPPTRRFPGARCWVIPGGRSPELPGAGSRLPPRCSPGCSQAPPGHSGPAGALSLANTARVAQPGFTSDTTSSFVNARTLSTNAPVS